MEGSWISFLDISLSIGGSLCLVVIYSLFIDVLFGHPSYWSLTTIPSQFIVPSPTANWPNHLTNHSKRAVMSSSILPNNDDLILYLLQFLNASDLIRFRQTSRHYSHLSSRPHIWLHLSFNAFQQVPPCLPILKQEFSQLPSPCSSAPSCILPQLLFFSYLNRFPQLLISFLHQNTPLAIPPLLKEFPSYHLCQCSSCQTASPSSPTAPSAPSSPHTPSPLDPTSQALVILHRSVYDLTSLLPHHPGGDAIIREYNGSDATRIYDLAMHSLVAERLSRHYSLWRREDFCDL
jgi:hypothetical protein